MADKYNEYTKLRALLSHMRTSYVYSTVSQQKPQTSNIIICYIYCFFEDSGSHRSHCISSYVRKNICGQSSHRSYSTSSYVCVETWGGRVMKHLRPIHFVQFSLKNPVHAGANSYSVFHKAPFCQYHCYIVAPLGTNIVTIIIMYIEFCDYIT